MNREGLVQQRRKQVGLMSFVRSECANLVNGHCIGMRLFSTKQFRKEGKCFLQDSKPCTYFEQYVLQNSKDRGCYHSVFNQYRKIKEIKMDLVRICRCGVELRPRHRFCDKCKKENRKKTKRENQRKFRRKELVCA